MKILYVEDELAKNIPRLVRLFSQYISAETINALHAFEADPSGFGAGPEEIKNIIEDAAMIEVEYRFPDALRKIVRQPGMYALFIVDRNLSEYDYTLEEVQQIDPHYTSTLYERYTQKAREGDYLLHKLALFSPVDVMKRFFFLTAYPAQEELQSAKDIEQLIDLGKFTAENFIEKGSDKDFERLRQIIDNTESSYLQSENRIVQYYKKTLAYCSSHDPEASLWMARKTAEALCRRIFEQEISSNTNTATTLDKFIELLGKQNILPQYVIIPLRTIQSYGNYGTHDQGKEGNIITTEYAQPCIQALTIIMKWYLSEYHHIQEIEFLTPQEKRTHDY